MLEKIKRILKSQVQITFYVNPRYWNLRPEVLGYKNEWRSFGWLFFAVTWVWEDLGIN